MTLLAIPYAADAYDKTDSISGVMDGDGCQVEYSYDQEVTLIAPLPSYGQDVVVAAQP
jgi:hypothetical protein